MDVSGGVVHVGIEFGFEVFEVGALAVGNVEMVLKFECQEDGAVIAEVDGGGGGLVDGGWIGRIRGRLSASKAWRDKEGNSDHGEEDFAVNHGGYSLE